MSFDDEDEDGLSAYTWVRPQSSPNLGDDQADDYHPRRRRLRRVLPRQNRFAEWNPDQPWSEDCSKLKRDMGNCHSRSHERAKWRGQPRFRRNRRARRQRWLLTLNRNATAA